MKPQLIAALAVCAFTGSAYAQGDNYVDGYGMFSSVDIGPFDDDGTGFGIKGEFRVHPKALLSAEYETVDFNNPVGDIDQLRFGASFGPGAGASGQGIYGRAQYVRLDFDGGSDDDGFAGHVGYGLPLSKEFRAYGEAGYVLLDDLSGPELLIGGAFQVVPNLAVFADFRADFYDVDGASQDLDLNEFRVGARFVF